MFVNTWMRIFLTTNVSGWLLNTRLLNLAATEIKITERDFSRYQILISAFCQFETLNDCPSRRGNEN